LVNGIVCFIGVDEMSMLMEKHVSMKNELLKLSGFRIKKLQNRVEDLLYKDSETRIKEYVIRYIKEFGERKEGKIVAQKLLSHSDIAHLTNNSRQTVNNIMTKLRKNNIITYNSKTIAFLEK